MKSYITIGKRRIGPEYAPLIVPEIGINHEGSVEKAERMILDAAEAGAECVKFQTHIPKEEMIFNNVVPSNASESIWDMMQRCALREKDEIYLKEYTEKKGLIFLSTPFSKAAVDRLEKMRISAFKIGSGECNNHLLVKYIASIGKPVIMSTGMNWLSNIKKTVEILRENKVEYALLHCTSMYPTPERKIRLRAIDQLSNIFPDAIVGYSDHSKTLYPSFAAIARGACVIEKHFTSDKTWPGSDIEISMDPRELKELIDGSKKIWDSLSEKKGITEEEKKTSGYAFASLVSIKNIDKGDIFTTDNIGLKRPGTGELGPDQFERILGKSANRSIPVDTQINKSCISE
jgi:N-acetylneuraminate synthase